MPSSILERLSHRWMLMFVIVRVPLLTLRCGKESVSERRSRRCRTAMMQLGEDPSQILMCRASLVILYSGKEGCAKTTVSLRSFELRK